MSEIRRETSEGTEKAVQNNFGLLLGEIETPATAGSYENSTTLPSFHEEGELPPGVFDCTLAELRSRLATNERREQLWNHLIVFLRWTVSTKGFRYAYLGGGFVSAKLNPADIDVILETKLPFGPDAIRFLEPFFRFGLDEVYQSYCVHLHFWINGFPGDVDFRAFFQYSRRPPRHCTLDSQISRRGIVRISLDSETEELS